MIGGWKVLVGCIGAVLYGIGGWIAGWHGSDVAAAFVLYAITKYGEAHKIEKSQAAIVRTIVEQAGITVPGVVVSTEDGDEKKSQTTDRPEPLDKLVRRNQALDSPLKGPQR